MEKQDLSDCSIIIPIHIDFSHRLENLHFLLNYFKKFFINYTIIIVEQDIKSKIDLSPQKWVYIEFLANEEEFSTSRVSNKGASLVKTPFFCKWDVDALIHPNAFFDAMEKLRSNPQTSLVLPYNRISFNLKSPFKEEWIRSFDFKLLPTIRPENSSSLDSPYIWLKSNDSKGLIHFFRTTTFKSLGGYNEEFIGWGYEDNEVLTRFKKLGYPEEVVTDYNAFHLEHPRRDGNKFQLLQNMYKLHAVEQMSPSQLREYIKSWTRF